MEFRTAIQIPTSHVSISHLDSILLCGSCFAENMGAHLQSLLFQIKMNPYGIIYNPVSIAESLKAVQEHKVYSADAIRFYNELYFSFDHHSAFSDIDMEKCLSHIQQSVTEAHHFLQRATWVSITLGSSYVYELSDAGQDFFSLPKRIVANCHKLPNTYFEKRLLELEETEAALQELADLFPEKKLLFTVSPVRHWRDGAVENMRSKSLLIEAVHRLKDRNKQVYYFPSYELMMDDLRDYRFYADDMLHPNEVAIDYIRKKFSETYFTEETKLLCKKLNALLQMKNHRPKFADTKAYEALQQKIENETRLLTERYPYLKF